MGDYCLGQPLGGQFWEVVWRLRDPSGLEPWLSIAAVVTIYHFNDFSSFAGPLSLFLHSSQLMTCVTSLSQTLLLRVTNLIHLFFYCRGGGRMGLSDLQEEISQQEIFSFWVRRPWLSPSLFRRPWKNLPLSEPHLVLCCSLGFPESETGAQSIY